MISWPFSSFERVVQNDLGNKISDGCAALEQSFDSGKQQQFAVLLTELERWSRRVNLTAIRDIKQMVSSHLLDSLSVRPFLEGKAIVDIGTGAGFPGLPLAIADPERSFVLLDSNRKKVSFVKHIVTTLGLGNVDAICVRAEDYAPGHTFDTVIARALASIPRIIEIGGHLAGKKGVLLALKGKYPTTELELTDNLPDRWAWESEKVCVPGLEQHARHIIKLKKQS